MTHDTKRPVLFLDIDDVLNYEGMPGWPTSEDWEEAARASFPDPFLERMLDAGRLALLRFVLEQVPEAGVVIHSTWRKGPQRGRLIPLLSRLSGVPEDRFIGTAPFKLTSGRTYEIMMWVENNDPKGQGVYAIVDDKALTFPDGEEPEVRGPFYDKWDRKRDAYWRKVGLQKCQVTTDPKHGLTQKDADALVALLKRKRTKSS